MFRPPADKPDLKRSIRPLYADTQATAQTKFLDPAWDRSKDILPGSVAVSKGGDVVSLFTGGTGKPIGLFALWAAPKLGVDEVRASGTNLTSVWVGGNDSQFEILAGAFDPTGNWSVPTDGTQKLLTGNADGLLTPTGATEANSVAVLVDVIGTGTNQKIVVSLDRGHA